MQTQTILTADQMPWLEPARFFAADRETAIEPVVGHWFAELDFDGEPGRLCEYLGNGRVQFEHHDTDVRAAGVFIAA